MTIIKTELSTLEVLNKLSDLFVMMGLGLQFYKARGPKARGLSKPNVHIGQTSKMTKKCQILMQL